MVVLNARPVLLVTAAVWCLWRFLVWHRRGSVDLAREPVIGLLFVWVLAVIKVTMFPLTIVFYDWYGDVNLTPFAGIAGILRNGSITYVTENIAGNVALFVPFGFLLPVLFSRVRGPSAVAWRAAAVSALIEFAQYLTRARSADIDDIMLNTVGALIGFALFALAAAVAARSRSARHLGARLVETSRREPLLAGAVPFVVTMALVVPMMLSTIVGNTLSGGRNGIETVATANIESGVVAARTDIGGRTFLLVESSAQDGQSGRAQLALTEFKQVAPGRYTFIGSTSSEPNADSSVDYYYPMYNPAAGERPMVIAWGRNTDGADSVRLSGDGFDTTVAVDPGAVFVAGTWVSEGQISSAGDRSVEVVVSRSVQKG